MVKATQSPELRQRRTDLESMLISTGWKHVMSRILELQVMHDGMARHRESSVEDRIASLNERSALLGLVEWVYQAADLPNPFNDSAAALYGKFTPLPPSSDVVDDPLTEEKNDPVITRPRPPGGQVS